MFSKIFIFALLGCSLVLASPVQEKEKDDGKFIEFNTPVKVKPEVAYKWLMEAGDVIKNNLIEGTNSAKGAFGSFIQSSKNFLENGKNKINEITSEKTKEDFDEEQEKALKQTIANLNKVVEYLNKQLISGSADKVVQTVKKTAKNISDKGSEFYNKGKDFVSHLYKPISEDVGLANKEDEYVGSEEVISAVDTLTHKTGQFGNSFHDASDKGIGRVHEAVDEGIKKFNQHEGVVHEIFSSTEPSTVNHEQTPNNSQDQEQTQSGGFFGNAGQNIGNRVDGRVKNLSKYWNRATFGLGK